LVDIQKLLDADQTRRVFDVKRSRAPVVHFEDDSTSMDKVCKIEWNEHRKVDQSAKSMFDKAGLTDNVWANEPANRKILTDSLEAYADVFAPNADGTLKRVRNADGSLFEVDLHLTSEVPVRSGSYRMSPVERAKIREGVLEMERLGVVRRQLSAWGAQCLAIKKCDGLIRIVTDFIKLNDNLENYCHPSATEADVYHCQFGKTRWTKIDLTKFYWQISLTERSQKYTGFTVPGLGSFVYCVLPMGVSPACAIAQALVEDCFRIPYEGPGPMHGKIMLNNIIVNFFDRFAAKVCEMGNDCGKT
jgi:hypothetical protein